MNKPQQLKAVKALDTGLSVMQKAEPVTILLPGHIGTVTSLLIKASWALKLINEIRMK